MKLHIIRLISIVSNGLGDPEANCIDLIYSFLLQRFDLDIYSWIHINQIGEYLNEVIIKVGKQIFINIRYPSFENFDSKSTREKNRIRLDCVHQSLMRIADYDNRLDKKKLVLIKDQIEQKDFQFDIIYKTFKNKKKPQLISKVIIHPFINKFDFYVVFKNDGRAVCKLLVYEGVPSIHSVENFFFLGKFKNAEEFILTGRAKEVEIHISINDFNVTYVNLTKYPKAPLFEMTKFRISEYDKQSAYQDWIHSLPPSQASFLTNSDN